MSVLALIEYYKKVQSMYRHGLGTETNTLKVVVDWLLSFNIGQPVLALLDFSSAFYTIDHYRFLPFLF